MNKLQSLLRISLLFAALLFSCSSGARAQQSPKTIIIHMVFTSDAHYGIKRKNFRGDTAVPSVKVNAAMIRQINTLPGLTLPADGGVAAGQKIKHIGFLLQTGDVSNRMEPPVQTAAASWAQFDQAYLHALHLTGSDGRPAKVLIVPGNHDAANALGSVKTLSPKNDPTAMVNIYNLMMQPKKPLTNQSFNYDRDKVNFARNIGGVHFLFMTIWPDSAQRIWMERDLAKVGRKTPVVIFAHDPPIGDDRHFSNPAGGNLASPGNKFEFLVEERYKDDSKGRKGETDLEQIGFAEFLKRHPNIKAYFHGHSNWNEFYTFQGPRKDVSLPVIRVDSPMKGKYSSEDETLLSFQLLSFDTVTRQLTVRECLWNAYPGDAKQGIVFGQKTTFSLKVK